MLRFSLAGAMSLFLAAARFTSAAAAATLDDDSHAIPRKLIGYDVHGVPVLLPLIGAGTWQYNDTLAYQSLCKTLSAGVPLIDTAYGYGNQKGVRRAMADCYTGKRSDLFILTKIPGGLTTSAQTHAAHYQNLIELNVGTVDHLMVHFPSDWEQRHASKEIRQQQWLAMEDLYYSGRARSLGVSHYCSQHLEDILQVATVQPTINQVEYHVGSGDVDTVLETCKQHNITFMSFSPLCGPCQYNQEDSLVHGTLVTDIAKKYNVTGAQVSLRFIVQQALEPGSIMAGVIPKSNHRKHIEDNMDIFSFELSKQDMERLHQASRPEAEAGDCDVP